MECFRFEIISVVKSGALIYKVWDKLHFIAIYIKRSKIQAPQTCMNVVFIQTKLQFKPFGFLLMYCESINEGSNAGAKEYCIISLFMMSKVIGTEVLS